MAKLKAKNVDLRFVNLELSNTKADFAVTDLNPKANPCLCNVVDVGAGKKQAIVHGHLHLSEDLKIKADDLKAKAFIKLTCDASMPITFKKGATAVDTGWPTKTGDSLTVECPDADLHVDVNGNTVKLTRSDASEKLDTTVKFVEVALADLFIVAPTTGLTVKADDLVNHVAATVELVKPAGKKSNDEHFEITDATGHNSVLGLMPYKAEGAEGGEG
jgi:hypothetical protein